LNEANGLLQNIISQPQQPNFQTQFSNTVEQLRDAAAHIREKLQPTQISLIEEIGGEKFFVVDKECGHACGNTAETPAAFGRPAKLY
jgi:hypothetical protein